MSETSALVIGHITVKDEGKWAEYRSQVPATLAPWGAELVFRGKRFEVFGGDHGHADTVVIRFPSVEAARGWFHSPAYQALIPLRQQAAEVVLVGFEPQFHGLTGGGPGPAAHAV
ncbi:MAG TPA: DUF1330 domain-containing protein [Rhodocyclaceae bacterium]|nr:DUF1330 domain-containing protein [Rhodocyclaceae bacterium]